MNFLFGCSWLCCVVSLVFCTLSRADTQLHLIEIVLLEGLHGVSCIVERWQLLFRPGQCSSGLSSLQPSPPVKSVSFHPLLPLWPWKVMYLCLLIVVLRNWARELGYFLERTTKVMDRVASLHPFSIHSSIEIRFLNCQLFCWGTDQKFGYPLQSLFFKLRQYSR